MDFNPEMEFIEEEIKIGLLLEDDEYDDDDDFIMEPLALNKLFFQCYVHHT